MRGTAAAGGSTGGEDPPRQLRQADRQRTARRRLIAPVQIHKRLVIYVQGYDPRGLAEYYRMFRREFRRTCELYGLTGKVGGPQNDPKRFTTAWDVTTHGNGWQVETHYLFLRWEDIIRNDFARPPWWKVVHMYRTMGAILFNGGVWRILKAHWRFGCFVLYPLVLTTFWLLLGAFVGVLCMKLVASLGAPALVGNIVGVVTGLGTFASMLWLTEPQTYLLYLCDDVISTPPSSPVTSDATGRSAWRSSPATLSTRCATAMPTRRSSSATVRVRSSPSTCSTVRLRATRN